MRRRFVIRFVVFVVLLYVAVAINWTNDHVIVPFTHQVAIQAAALLNVFGENVGVEGTVMRSPRFAIEVENGCNAVDAAMILVGAVAAFPATLRSRALAVVAGLILLHAINLVRLASLFLLGAHHPKVFDLFHVAVWQAVVIAAAFGMFLVWSTRYAERTPERAA